MHYVISDLHGCLKEFQTLLKKISFSKDDVLYVVGDVLDRGKKPITLLEYIMNQDNIHLLMGNHELMFLEGIREYFKNDTISNHWKYNGGDTTMKEFEKRSKKRQKEIVEYVMNLPVTKEIEVNGQKYLLVHGGFDTSRVSDYHLEEEYDLMWYRGKFLNKPYKDYTMIMGHIPTPTLAMELQRAFIFKRYDEDYYDEKIVEEAMLAAKEAKIVNCVQKKYIDCGLVFGYQLSCLRLEDQETFYVKSSKKI